MVLLTIGLYKALHADILAIDGSRRSWPVLLSARVGRGSTVATTTPDWQTRLQHALSTPDRATGCGYLRAEVVEARAAVSDAMQAHGVDSRITDQSDRDDDPFVELEVHGKSEEPFLYRVVVLAAMQVDPHNPGQSGRSYYQLDIVL